MTELVRYMPVTKESGVEMLKVGHGEYVLYSQVTEIIAALSGRLKNTESERDHWKANHDNMVRRNAVLSQRPDLPVDRLPAIREYERMLKNRKC